MKRAPMTETERTEALVWIAAYQERCKNGPIFDGADDYYWHKDRARELSARLSGMTAREYDPVGAWHAMQSN